MSWSAPRYATMSCLLLLIGVTPVMAADLPWETWIDLHRLPELHRGHQALLRSSHCLDGCRFDRHSAGDWRYLYVDGEEGVIFEEAGAGAISRIWMTMGQGTSVPLDPAIRIRIYIDGAMEPAIDLPIPALFDGSTAPFLAPLVGDRTISSGGNYSYVPIPYRTGCKVALVGAHDERLWFQINYHRLAQAEGVVSFTGSEDLSDLSDLLAGSGADPWPPANATTVSGLVSVEPGKAATLVAQEGQGSVTVLRFGVDQSLWHELDLTLVFDGQQTVHLPFADFFAVGRGGPSPTCSLFVGVDSGEFLFSYFPMPFFESVGISVSNRGSSSAAGIDYEVRIERRLPSGLSGLFGAVLSDSGSTELGFDFPLLSLAGEGKVAASFLEVGSTADSSREYLEGDERFYIDASFHPAVYGTGVEDYFNGGFYFDMGPFSQPLHGAPYTELNVGGLPMSAAYRMFLTDGMTFANRLEAGLEGGPTGNVPMRARAVTYFYRRNQPRLHRWDLFDVGSPVDRVKHEYEVDGPYELEELDALFEGEPPRRVQGGGVSRLPGSASFVLRAHPTTSRLRLRRRFDAAHPGQRATVLIGGVEVGRFPAVYENQDRRWRELDIDLDPEMVAPIVEITVIAEAPPVATASHVFTEFRYELWGDGAAEVFSDGFESGDLLGWSASRGEMARTSEPRTTR